MSESLPRDASSNLGLPYLWPAQAQKHVTHNEALDRLDALSQIVLQARGAVTPPPLPAIGQLWALGSLPTGDWTGEAGRLALWDGTGWQFMDPKAGWIAWDAATGQLCRHDGTIWQSYLPAHLEGLGIGTAPDAQNRLSVAAPSTLLSHEGAGHQLKINKAAASDTASLLFQDNWSGRAEIGLTGNDALSVKVSADGAAWTTALQVNAATGGVTMGGPLSGTAVTQTARDQTVGRLMKTGDGGVLGPVAHDGVAVADLPYGFWGNAVAATPPTGMPESGSALWAGWHAGNSAAALQFAARCDGTRGIYARARSGTTWAAWRKLYDQDSLLGTVSHDGTANTGAVLESGGTTTARYLRLACGTQICWGEVVLTSHAVTTAAGALFTSATAASLTFNKTFTAAPQLTLTVVEATGNPAIWPGLAGVTTSGGTVRLLSAAAVTPATIRLSYQAVGRWRA